MYFDSHAHYNDTAFEEDRDILLKELKDKGVDWVMNAGADMESSDASIKLAEQYDFIYASVGVHPHDVKEMKEEDLVRLKIWAEHPKVKAIGEIGLDFYYNHSEEEQQVFWFQKQLELAKELKMPVIIHSRDASQQTFDMIQASGIKEGVIHCFSGSKELAKEYVKQGFYIGIGGALTFKNAKKILEVVENIPLESILIETDCPYLTPVPHRGKRNDSTYLSHVVEKISEIKGVSTQEIAEISSKNARNLFSI